MYNVPNIKDQWQRGHFDGNLSLFKMIKWVVYQWIHNISEQSAKSSLNSNTWILWIHFNTFTC